MAVKCTNPKCEKTIKDRDAKCFCPDCGWYMNPVVKPTKESKNGG